MEDTKMVMEKFTSTVLVKNSAVQIPNQCGVITEITYSNGKFAKIIQSSKKCLLLEFYNSDNPKEVTIHSLITYQTTKG